MTDKVQKIREEVERIIKENRERSSIEGYAAVEQLRKVLAYIESLQEEPVSEDINDAANNLYPYKEMYDVELPYPSTWDANEDERNAFIAGAQWGKERIINKACEWLKENATYVHPRKGVETCMVNLTVFKETMEE